MHFRFDVATAFVHVQLGVHVTVILQREEQLVGVDDAHGAMRLDVAGVHRPGAIALDVQHRLIDLGIEDEREGLEPLDDLVHVLEHALHRLVLVHDAIEAERPDRAAAQRAQQEPAKRIAERVPKAALERLQAELGYVGIVFALRHLDEVRTDKAGKIDAHDITWNTARRSAVPAR